MSAAVVCKGVYKKYTKSFSGVKEIIVNRERDIRLNQTLKDINFSLESGKSLGLLGGNGAGKSTLLSLILGVIQPDKGRIDVNGKIIPLMDLGSGFHHELTGMENIFLFGAIHGVSVSDMRKKIDEILNFSELRESINTPVRTYSKGMLARLGFSVAISIPGDIILIDEVLAVGDYKFQEKCMNFLSEFNKKGGTLIIVSHDISAVQNMCDKCLVLDKSEVKFFGNTSDAVTVYNSLME